jgi:hypothetical protein
MATVLHSSLTTTDLHEPKGVAAAAADKVYVSNGAGSGAWTAVDHPVFMQKHIAGLTWSNAADASNDITVLAGSCRDSTNTADMILSAAITKRIDASWTVGDNQGGFDTGSVSATGVYHLYLIKRTDTGVVDALFSATNGTPTLPTNYTKFRRIGSIYRQSSVNAALTVTELPGGGIECMRNTPVEGSSLAAASTGTAYSLAQFPNNATGLEAIFSYRSNSTTASLVGVNFSPTTASIGDIASTSQTAATTITNPDSGADTITFVLAGSGRCRANSGQIKMYSSNPVVWVTTMGWNDPRRD